MRKLLLVLFAVVLFAELVLAAPTRSLDSVAIQNKAGKGLMSMTLEELLEVEITGATLTPLGMKSVPSAVTVFSRDEISRMGLDSLNELMNFAPGFQSYRSSGTPLDFPFSARGRRIGAPSAEVLVLVDGSRLNEPRTGGTGVAVPLFPLSQIERVEFIRGPGSAVYGSNAMLGVINIVTRSAENSIGFGAGSFDRRSLELSLSQDWGDAEFDLLANWDSDNGDTFRVGDPFGPGSIDTDDPRERVDLNLKWSWNNTQIAVQHYQYDSEHFLGVAGGSNLYNQRHTNLSSISLKQAFEFGDISSYLWLGYQYSDFDITLQFTPVGALSELSDPSSEDALVGDTQFSGYNEFRAQYHNSWEIDEESSLQFGAELRRLDVPEGIVNSNYDFQAFFDGDFPVSYFGGTQSTSTIQNGSRRDVIGLYAQYQREFAEKTHVTLGLRYDDFSEIGSQLSPRIGIVHELSESHSLKVLYGSAFRAPSENELNVDSGTLADGNPELRPESVDSFDLIWVGQWKRTGVSFGYFENHFTDAIVFGDDGSGLLNYSNLSSDEMAAGFEFEISQELNDNFLFRVAYTYLSEQPVESFAESDRLASVMLNYREGRWNANFGSTYRGGSQTLFRGQGVGMLDLDSYWEAYGKIRYRFDSGLDLFLQGKNLFDETIRTPTFNSLPDRGVPNRGREVLLGIRLNY